MTNLLQEILDRKWPISDPNLRPTTRKGRERMRRIFTAGYGAGIIYGFNAAKLPKALKTIPFQKRIRNESDT